MEVCLLERETERDHATDQHTHKPNTTFTLTISTLTITTLTTSAPTTLAFTTFTLTTSTLTTVAMSMPLFRLRTYVSATKQTILHVHCNLSNTLNTLTLIQ